MYTVINKAVVVIIAIYDLVYIMTTAFDSLSYIRFSGDQRPADTKQVVLVLLVSIIFSSVLTRRRLHE